MCGFNSTVNHDYTEFKRSVIASVYFDILIITETHCIREELVTIENYIVYQFNRTGQDNARRGSGGVAIAIHNSVLDNHVVISVDKGMDGQLSIKLKHVENDFLLGILALYLPPENYIYGRDPENFFNHASALYEDLSGCDLVIGGGI